MTPEQLHALQSIPLHAIATPNRLSLAFSITGIKQDTAADATGISAPRISLLVRGKGAAATIPEGQKLARFFGCALPDLFPEAVHETETSRVAS